MHRLLGIALVAAVVTIRVGRAAEQDTFTRPNANECASPTSAVNFLEYAAMLGDAVQCGPQACDYKEQASLFFDLEYRENYKVVSYNQADVDVTYVLYQCGTMKPDDQYTKSLNASTTAYVEIPLTAIATGDSTAAWMMEELGVEDRVRYSTDTATSPCMLKIALPQADGGCGRPFTDPLTFEPVANITEYDAEFAFGSSDSTGAKQVAFRVSSDPGPLRRLEHLVYMAAFFNLEAKAIEYYAMVEAAYTALVAQAGATAPVVAWGIHSPNVTGFGFANPDGVPLEKKLYSISFAQYKVSLTADAGGEILNQANITVPPAYAIDDSVYFAEEEFESLGATQAAVKEALKGVDIFIDESFVSGATLELFLEDWGITDEEAANIPFLKNDKLYKHDKDQTSSGYDDWFGEAVVRPDITLADLRAIVAPAQNPNHNFTFFRNLSLNETTTSFGPELCTDLECTAYSNQKPLLLSSTVAPMEAPRPAPDDAPVPAPAPTPVPGGGAAAEGAEEEGAEDQAVAPDTARQGSLSVSACSVLAMSAGALLLL